MGYYWGRRLYRSKQREPMSSLGNAIALAASLAGGITHSAGSMAAAMSGNGMSAGRGQPWCGLRTHRVTISINSFEMRYPGTLNKGPFRSFSDVLMSAAFCSASVLACGRFDFNDMFNFRRQDRDRLIDATEVRDDSSLPTLSCRIELQLKDGARRNDRKFTKIFAPQLMFWSAAMCGSCLERCNHNAPLVNTGRRG